MKSFIIFMEKLPLVVKVILALPFVDIVWVIYRMIRSMDQKSYIGLGLAIIILFIGIPFLWAVDIISILFIGHVLWID